MMKSSSARSPMVRRGCLGFGCIFVAALAVLFGFVVIISTWKPVPERLLDRLEREGPPPEEVPRIPRNTAEWTDPRSYRNRDSTWLTPSFGRTIRVFRQRTFVPPVYRDCLVRQCTVIMDFDGRGSIGLANRVDIFDAATTPPGLLSSTAFENWSSVHLAPRFLSVATSPWNEGGVYEYGSPAPCFTYNGGFSSAVSTGTAWVRFLVPIWPEEADDGKYDMPLGRELRAKSWSRLPAESTASLCLTWRTTRGELDRLYLQPLVEDGIATNSTARDLPRLWPAGTNAPPFREPVLALPQVADASPNEPAPPLWFSLEVQRSFHWREKTTLSGRIKDDHFEEVTATSGVVVLQWRE